MVTTTRELPDWARKRLAPDGAERIEAAIAAAESGTSGEIVPVVVRRSSTIGHIPLLAFALLALCFLAADLPGHLAVFGGSYWLWKGVAWLLALALGILLARFNGIQRLLTPRPDQSHQVESRAEIEFYEQGIGETEGNTGILLFVSLMEHRAVVLADHAISERVDPAIWHELIELMIEGVKRDDLASGMTRAIERCGEILSPHFPIDPSDRNELRDHLIVKD